MAVKKLSSQKKAVLEAVDLYRFYHSREEETLALRGVSLVLEAGEMVALMGPSGSGKSSLMNCLAGLDEPDGGYVLLQGNRLTRCSEAERAAQRAAHIGVLMQSGNLFEYLSVAQNVQLQMALAHYKDTSGPDTSGQNLSRLDMLLGQVGLQHRRHARPSQLSGGETARAGLAVALAAAPDLLLADEPTGEVDMETEENILALLADFQRQGSAILLATHSPLVAQRADRILHLRDGRLEDVDGSA